VSAINTRQQRHDGGSDEVRAGDNTPRRCCDAAEAESDWTVWVID